MNKDIKPSGWGIIVNKSKATKTYPLRGTVFPKGFKFNYEPVRLEEKTDYLGKIFSLIIFIVLVVMACILF